MKNVIFILTLLLFSSTGLICTGQNIISNHTNHIDVEEFVATGLNELDITGIHIIILPISILPQYTSRSDINGFVETERPTENLTIYRLYINDSRPWSRLTRTISHELLHVLQYYEGRINRDGDTYIFEGEEYTEAFPYRMRPWEAEAFNNSIELRESILSQLN